MKKTAMCILVGALVAAIWSCSGTDEKKLTQKTAKVWGNCEQCKATIEKAGKINGVGSINWNEDTKLLTLQLDTGTVTLGAVLKEVADAGYDNELYTAPGEAYASLPDCCQYERKP